MNEQGRPVPHRSIETAVLGDEAVLYDERSGMVHHLNASAYAVWARLDGRPIAEIIDTLTVTTGMPREDLAPDVVEVLAAFAAGDLLSDGAGS